MLGHLRLGLPQQLGQAAALAGQLAELGLDHGLLLAVPHHQVDEPPLVAPELRDLALEGLSASTSAL